MAVEELGGGWQVRFKDSGASSEVELELWPGQSKSLALEFKPPNDLEPGQYVIGVYAFSDVVRGKHDRERIIVEVV